MHKLSLKVLELAGEKIHWDTPFPTSQASFSIKAGKEGKGNHHAAMRLLCCRESRTQLPALGSVHIIIIYY